MKVKELIEILKKENEENVVLIRNYTGENTELSFLGEQIEEYGWRKDRKRYSKKGITVFELDDLIQSEPWKPMEKENTTIEKEE